MKLAGKLLKNTITFATSKLPSANFKSPSPECYTTFFMMTIYSDTLYWSGITPIFDPITDLDLITEFDLLPNYERSP